MFRLLRKCLVGSVLRNAYSTAKVAQPAAKLTRTRRRLTTAFIVSTGLGVVITASLQDKEKDDSELNGTSVQREWTVDVLAEKLGTENFAVMLEALFKGDSALRLKFQEFVKHEKPFGKSKVVNDIVHGHIELHPVCVAIVDTPEFQRLRYLKQMGTCDFVYPGAVHTRFEHSIGVYHLAGLLLKRLQETQPELGITDKDVLCVQIAGLCHDLGHGPFSHMFDTVFMSSIDSNSRWTHEQASIDMFDHMCNNDKLKQVFKDNHLDERDLKFIKEQIKGPQNRTKIDWQYEGRPKEKGFLYDIVANKRNGIDVDKWDYISRDSLHLGMKSNFDHLRFILYARVISVNNEPQICLRDKEAYGIHQMYESRYILHKMACQHRVTSATSLMIADALKEINEVIKIPKADGTCIRMSDCIKKENMDAYTNLTEEIIRRIVLKRDRGDPHLRKAKKLLQDLWSRNLYKFIDESSPIKDTPFKDAQRDDIKQKILKLVKEDPTIKPESVEKLVEELQDHVTIELVNFNYGMKGKNPWKHIHFYSKRKPEIAVILPTEQVSFRLPKHFEEQIIRVFFKPTDDDRKNEEYPIILRDAFRAWCKGNERKWYADR